MTTLIRVQGDPVAAAILAQCREEQDNAERAIQRARENSDGIGVAYWSAVRDERRRTEGWIARAFEAGVRAGLEPEEETPYVQQAVEAYDAAEARRKLLERA